MKTRRRTVIQQFGGKCTARQHSRVWKNTFVASGIHTSKKQKNFKRMKSYIQANMNFSLLAQLFCHSHYTVPPGVTAKLSCSHWGGPSSPSKGINGTTACLWCCWTHQDLPGSIHPQTQPRWSWGHCLLPSQTGALGLNSPILWKLDLKSSPFIPLFKTPKNKQKKPHRKSKLKPNKKTPVFVPKLHKNKRTGGQAKVKQPELYQDAKDPNVYLGHAVEFSKDSYGVLRVVSDLLRENTLLPRKVSVSTDGHFPTEGWFNHKIPLTQTHSTTHSRYRKPSLQKPHSASP